MKPIFSLFIAIVISLMIACQPTPPKPSAMARFTGLWKMHIFEYRDSSGNWQEYFWNKGGTGYVIYDGMGHMAIHVTPKDYKQSVVSLEKGIDSLNFEELQAAVKLFSSNYVYVANSRVLEDQQIVEHERLSHTFPEEWHQVVQRRYEFKGDTLKLSPVEGSFERRLTLIRQE
ncbi:MAG: lipocalin-like domain-containing protein [Bacteroidota bacterium]